MGKFTPSVACGDSSPKGTPLAKPYTLYFNQRLSRYAKGSLPEGAVKTVRF